MANVEQAENPGLRRKTARRAGPVAMQPARALALALARGAQEEMALAVDVDDIMDAKQGLDAVMAAIGEHALMAVLDGPEGATGLAVLSAPFLGALVAQRMTGRLPRQGAVARPPTRIDADMVRDLIDRVLAAFAAQLEGAAWARGFRYRGYLEDARLVRFSLLEGTHRILQADLSIGGEASAGAFVLALPDAPAQAEAGPDAPGWGAALRTQVLGSHVEVEAVMTRLHLPLSQIAELAVGDVLPLPGAAVAGITLEGVGHVQMAGGELGQSRGARAVRMRDGPGQS